MVDHDQQRTLHALQRQRPDAEHHEAEVRDGGVGDELLEVRLHHRDQTAVDDPDQRQHHDDELHGLIQGDRREERQREPEEPVGPHLQQDAGEDHGPRRRRLHVRVGKPGVQREQGHLDGEREEEGPEQPPRDGSEILRVAQEVRVPERVHPARLARVQIEHEDRHQHEQRAEERIDEELDRRVQPVVAAPDADDEVHRDEHHFPHHIEQEKIEGDKDAEHAGRQDEQQRVKRGLTFCDVAPAAQDRERHQERREEHQEQRDAVHANGVVNPPRRDPGMVGGELDAPARHECPPQRHGERKLDQAGGQRDIFREPGRNEEHHRAGDQRPGEQRGEDPGAVHQPSARHRTSSTPMTNTATYVPTCPVCNQRLAQPSARAPRAAPFTAAASTMR